MQGKDVVLGLLNKKSMTGYEIKEVFESQLSYFFDGTFGMIYPLLKKLEKENLVKSDAIIQSGKPNKNIYTITAEGKKIFEDYLHSELSEESYKSDFLMRLYFGENLDRATLISLIESEIVKKEVNIDKMSSHYSEWKENGMNGLQEITFRYGMAQYESTLKILKEALKALM